jgi:subtilisin family serine protease
VVDSSTAGDGPNRAGRAPLLILLSVALVAAGGVVAAPADAAPPDRDGRARVIVRLQPGADPDAEARNASGAGAAVSHTFRNVFRGFAAGVPEQALRGLQNNPRVVEITPDDPVRGSATQTEPPWGLDRIDQRALPLSSSYTYLDDGAGVTAYVIDSGVLAEHTDLGGRVRSGYTSISDGRGTSDCNGHGTHVAGTVAGTRAGVAKAVRPVAVRVLDCTGSGATSGVIAGLDWAAGDHAPGTPAVANLSLGGPANANLDAAVQGLINDGVTVVAAAGNENVDACTSSPARAGAALTVGATDRNDARASFSNYGTCVDLFAPGVGISSDWYTSTTATASLSGTSMAAPHVAGVAALLLSSQPALTPAQVAEQLRSWATTDVVGNPGSGSPNRLLHLPNAPTPTPVGLTDPGAQTGTTGAAARLQLSATGGAAPYTWAATGLPPGLSLDPATGLVTGTPTTAGTYQATVTVEDSAGTTATRTVTWTITGSTACSGQRLTNPGFESGTTGWSSSAGVIAQHGTRAPAHSGTWSALLGGKGRAQTQTLSRSVSVPAGCRTYVLSFWLRVDSAETTTSAGNDRLKVTLGSTTAATYSNLDRGRGYVERRFNLAAFAGRTATLAFAATENSSRQTSFVLDDITLTVS